MERKDGYGGLILALIFTMPAQGEEMRKELYARPLSQLHEEELARLHDYLSYYYDDEFRPSPSKLVKVMSELLCPVRTFEQVYDEVNHYYQHPARMQPYPDRPNIWREVEGDPVYSHPVTARVIGRLGGYKRLREWDKARDGSLRERAKSLYLEEAAEWERKARGQFLQPIAERDPFLFALYQPFSPPEQGVGVTMATLPPARGKAITDPNRLEHIKGIAARSISS